MSDAGASRHQAEDRVVLPKTEARQSVTGHNVRYVLAFSLIAVVAAFLIVYLVYV